MSKKIRSGTSEREVIRFNKRIRIKKKAAPLKGQVARLVVFRSNKFLYCQLVDDLKGVTLCQANTAEKTFSAKSKKNLEAAKSLGKLIGERAKTAKVEKILFDRSGYEYHGRIKALAEGAREAGLKF